MYNTEKSKKNDLDIALENYVIMDIGYNRVSVWYRGKEYMEDSRFDIAKDEDLKNMLLGRIKVRILRENEKESI